MNDKWWFTFGSGPFENYYVIIKGSFSETRVKMTHRFDTKWCGQYSTAEEAGVEKYHLRSLDNQIINRAFLKKLVEMVQEYELSGDYVAVILKPPTDEELEPLG